MKNNNTNTTRGFTLIEVMIATLVVGTAFVAAGRGMIVAVESNSVLAEQPMTADMLASEIYALALALPRDVTGTEGVTSSANILALDSLVGATFNPPIKANGSTISSLSGWTQQVDLSLYSLDDLATASTESAFVPVVEGEHNLYRLSVDILSDGSVVDTFSWWIKP